MELYARVRRAVVVDKMSEREAAKQFGLARETVRKMLRYSVPPGYRRQQPARRPKLDAWVGAIDQILEDDKAESRKQRHTAKRIFERLRDEHGYTGGYTIVKDYVRLRKLSRREMFVPLTHPAGDAQADFGEAMVVIAGVECKAHYLAMDLPQSDDCFVMAFPAETTEAFLEGHNHAFAYFGGVTAHDFVRQHQDCGGADSGRWDANEDTSVHRAAKPLPVRREVRTAGQGQRQGQSGRAGGLRAEELHGAPSAIRHLGSVQR